MLFFLTGWVLTPTHTHTRTHARTHARTYKLKRDKSNSKQRRRWTKTNTNTEHDVHHVTLRHRLPTIVRLALIHISYFSHQIQKHLRFPQWLQRNGVSAPSWVALILYHTVMCFPISLNNTDPTCDRHLAITGVKYWNVNGLWRLHGGYRHKRSIINSECRDDSG